MFPLPVPHEERTDPCQFIPDCEDRHGAGERMWRIMSMLRITQGKLAGKTLGEVAPPWQEKWIRALYGTTEDDGSRTYDEAFLLIAKKQGKSTISGMLAIAHTIAFPENRGVGIILADSKEQAGLVYDSMASTVEADPFLADQFHVRRYRADIIHRETQTHLKAVAAEFAAVVGQIPSFYIVDELHLLGLKPKGGQLVKQLSSGIAVRENPLGIYITTAPVGHASGIYTSTYNRAHRILEGNAEGERMLPVCFEMPPDADVDDSSLWWMANPSMNYTITEEWLIREHRIAKQDPDPGTLANFLSQHLNIHAQERMGIDRWLPTDVWDAFAFPDIVTLDYIKRECSPIFASVDAGYRGDPSCLLVMGKHSDGTWKLWDHQWLHADAYKGGREKAPYDEFVEAGELTVGETENQDVVEIYAEILALHRTGQLVAVGVDPAKLKSLTLKMEDQGILVYSVPQGWKLNPHIIEAERMIYSGEIEHHGGPMLRWNFQNALLAERGQAKALTKPSDLQGGSGTNKIDGAVCVVMCVAVATDPENALGLTGVGELLLV